MGVRPPAVWCDLLVFRLDADWHQRLRHAIVVVQKNSLEPQGAFHHRRAHQHRNVDGALRHRRRLAVSGFSAGELGQIYPDAMGHRALRRHARRVLHDVSAVREISAVHRHLGSEGRNAAGQPAPSARRRERKKAMSAKHYGIIAEFDSPAAILRAAEKVRDAGYRRWDTFTPFPIHGMEQVMGLKNSLVGWVSLAMGAGAFLSVVGLIWFANAFDYPLIVGGKPMFSEPMTFVPAYIMLIMGSAIGALVGMLALNQLPRMHHPLFAN